VIDLLNDLFTLVSIKDAKIGLNKESVIMKKCISIVLLISVLVVLGCATHIHTIGKGPSQGATVEARQWYVLWGLVPINQIDSKKMAGEAKDYQIQTQASPLDVIINIFTTYVSVTSRTVTVTK